MKAVELQAELGKLKDWFWEFGSQRQGRYALGTGGWLAELYHTADLTTPAISTLGEGRPTMAVWGPSASGKSTLVASYLDRNADAGGRGGALEWDGGVPARFVVGDPSRSDVIVLNPFHQGSDASGCVSRFTSRVEIFNPQYPVELSIAQGRQILHAIAVGYLSECRECNPAGKTIYWDEETILARLATLDQQGVSRAPTREAYDRLYEFTTILEMLITSEYPRYRNLKVRWPQVRRSILEHPVLVREAEKARVFFHDVLWDGHPALDKLAAELTEHAEGLATSFNGRRIYCSLEVAAWFLDIDSYYKADRNASFFDKIRMLRYDYQNNAVLIGRNGSSLFASSPREFGRFQACVWEMSVPLRQDRLKLASQPFSSFLEKADLLDFPGVAKQQQGGPVQNLLDLQNLKDASDPSFLTRLFKRGKTGSIIASYSRSLSIDGFTILNRVGDFVTQPGQILTGISAWWRPMCPDFTFHGELSPSPLPYNMVFTFFGKLVSNVMMSGIKEDEGLSGLPRMLEQLGALANPAVLSASFATTYLQFPEGQFIYKGSALGSDNPRLLNAIAAIERDDWIGFQFANPVSRQSLRAMAQDGGCDYLFTELVHQIDHSQRNTLVDGRLSDGKRTAVQLIREAVPEQDAQAEVRLRCLRSFKELIESAISIARSRDVVARVSYDLRTFLNVSGDDLEPIPLSIAAGHDAIRRAADYVERQFANWAAMGTTTPKCREMDGDGILGQIQDAGRLRGFLYDDVDFNAMAQWLSRHFGHLTYPEESRICRRYIAIHMARAILGIEIGHGTPHSKKEEITSRLRELIEQPSFGRTTGKKTAHDRFVASVIDRVNQKIARPALGAREAQPGDSQLVILAKKMQALN